ncbi:MULTISPECIES: ABC transporter substrate-binding protein [unclassified Variovorax]
MYTNDAMVSGTPTALASSDNSDVFAVTTGHPNMTGDIGDTVNGFKKKFNDDYYYFTTYDGLKLLGQAMANAQSTNPVAVAAALEGLSIKSYSGEITMRKSDHQLQQAIFITRWQKADKKNAYSVENTGYTFAPVKRIEAYQASTPTICKMKRPS